MNPGSLAGPWQDWRSGPGVLVTPNRAVGVYPLCRVPAGRMDGGGPGKESFEKDNTFVPCVGKQGLPT